MYVYVCTCCFGWFVLQDIGDGWWEGKLESGETGLFPESYVEVCIVLGGVALHIGGGAEGRR